MSEIEPLIRWEDERIRTKRKLAAMNALNPSADILEKLEALRTELADLAFHLDRRGRVDAADLAIAVSGRLAELRDNVQWPVSGAKRAVR